MERWQWRGTPHSTKLQHYWSLTIRLFSVISSTHLGGILPFCRDAVDVFYRPRRLGQTFKLIFEDISKMLVFFPSIRIFHISFNWSLFSFFFSFFFFFFFFFLSPGLFLVDFDRTVIGIVTIFPLAFSSSSLFYMLFGTLPSAPYTIGITVSFMFPNFLALLQDSDICWSLCFLFFFSFHSWNDKIPDSGTALLLGLKKTLTVSPVEGGKNPSSQKCPGYDTNLHLMVRLQFWRSEEYGVPLHCHY